MTLAPEAAAAPEDAFNPELPFTSIPHDSFLEDGSIFVRYLNRMTGTSRNLPFLREPSAGSSGGLGFGKLQAGYGRIFTDDSVITRGRNGTAWEEGSCFYLKTSFRF
jgi:hypothetical protein